VAEILGRRIYIRRAERFLPSRFSIQPTAFGLVRRFREGTSQLKGGTHVRRW
jgi:hypothetical protein